MRQGPTGSGKRKPVNLSIPALSKRRAAGLNLPPISAAALRDAAQHDHDRRWKRRTSRPDRRTSALGSGDELPLERYRLL